MSYKVGFPAFGNFCMLADSFSVVSIQYVALGLRWYNIIVDSLVYKCGNMNVESIRCYIRC